MQPISVLYLKDKNESPFQVRDPVLDSNGGMVSGRETLYDNSSLSLSLSRTSDSSQELSSRFHNSRRIAL
jgi:hypothetical protein